MSALTLLLADAERHLARIVDGADDPVDRAFIAYVSRAQDPAADLADAVHSAATARGASRSYRDVAVLGFAASSGVTSATSHLAEAARWLSGTLPTVSGVPTGIVDDRVALLGASLVCRHIDSETAAPLRDWLLQLAVTTKRDSPTDHVLLRAARNILTNALEPSTGAFDTQTVFARLGLLPRRSDLDEEGFVTSVLRGELASEPRLAVLQLVALKDVRERAGSIRTHDVSRDDVCELLRRLSFGMQQWTWEEKPLVRGGTARQWHVDHEYHVQNILWAVLAPLFPDLQRETYTAPLGNKQPRLDLGLPALRLIIEVKFWRPTTSASSLIEEIAADASLYFSVSERRYDEMVVFVWDDARRTEEHDLLERGLSEIRNVRDAVLLARPGKMT